MKKLVSLALFTSIFVSNANILAVADNIAGSQEQPQSSGQKIISEKNLAELVSGESVKSQPKPEVIDKLKKILKKVLVTGGAIAAIAGSSYLTYKLGEKIGLNKEIKNLLICINKNKMLRNLLIGGAIASTVITCLTVWIAVRVFVETSKWLAEKIVRPVFEFFEFNAAVIRGIMTRENLYELRKKGADANKNAHNKRPGATPA